MGVKNVYTVLITGASGLVGRYTSIKLAESGMYQVLAIGSDKERLKADFEGYDNIVCCSNDDLFRGATDLSDVDYLIHCAFTRNNDPEQVASALAYTERVFRLAKGHPQISILHISTRSVYKEPDMGELNTEDSPVVPSGAIGIAKYASELMLDLMCSGSGQSCSHLRLASVNELKTEHVMVRPMNVFVDRMLKGEPISVVGGMQVMSFIAPQDIADAIMAILSISPKRWDRIYNVGTGWQGTETLLKIAELVRTIGVEKYGLNPVEIQVERKEINMRAGLDISRITAATGWSPKRGLADMIEDLYELKRAR